VIVLSTISSFFWNGTLIWLGSSIGENWELIGVYLDRYNTIVSILIVAVIAAFLIHRYVIVKKNLTQKDE
jgi:membrane protein DedA with SNARE-associated domain